GADDAFADIVNPAERIKHFAGVLAVQADGKCVDCEIAPVLVISEGSGNDGRFSRVFGIGLLPCANEFNVNVLIPEHGSPEGLEDGHLYVATDLTGHGTCHGRTVADDYNVNILLRMKPSHDMITDETTDDICLHMLSVSHPGHYLKNPVIREYLHYKYDILAETGDK